MNVDHQVVGIGGDNCKGPNPFARSGLLPVLPNAGDAEGRAILHRYRVGLLGLLALSPATVSLPIGPFNGGDHLSTAPLIWHVSLRVRQRSGHQSPRMH